MKIKVRTQQEFDSIYDGSVIDGLKVIEIDSSLIVISGYIPNVAIRVIGNSRVEVFNNALVYATGDSIVGAHDNSCINASENAYVSASDYAVVYLYHSAKAVICGNAVAHTLSDRAVIIDNTDNKTVREKKESKRMQKWNGKLMCESSFKGLQKGDRYVLRTGEERVFDHFTKDGTGAVNTLKKVNRRSEMLWPTSATTQKATTTTTTKETSTMSGMEKSGGLVSDTLARVVNDGEQAAWREASRQCVRNITAALAPIADRHLPKGVVGLVLGKLNTDMGRAFVGFTAGHVMAAVPSFSSDPRLKRLAEEMRVASTQWGFSVVADAVLDPIRDSIVDIVKGLTA